MATTLTIGGTSVDLTRTIALQSLRAYSRGGYPTLSFSARTAKQPVVPDPYLGKEAVLAINGTTYFRGNVVSAHPQYGQGLVIGYQADGLRHRGDRIPHTDSNTGAGSSAYNLPIEDRSYTPASAGRTIGQILTDVLTMPDNGAALTTKGIGNLTLSGGVYSLPSNTTTDLATLAVIPPTPVVVSGDKLLTAVEGVLSQWAPLYMLHIDPTTGALRFLNTSTFTPQTFTMGTDPIEPAPLSRDWSDCYSRVQIRGAPVAVMALLKLSENTLAEAFDHDSLTSSAAKAAWHPNDFHRPGTGTGQSQDFGNCTCASTTTINITDSKSTVAYASNYWDQTTTGRKGTINLTATTVPGITQFWTARVVSSTAQGSAGGSFSVTIDAPLPHTNFNKYTLSGQAYMGPSRVWTRYQIMNTAIIPKLTSQSTYPQAFVAANGAGVTLTSLPMGAVMWPISGSNPPYNSFPLPFTFAANDPYIYFALPTYIVANNQAPADVWALIPYWQTNNVVTSPQDVGGNPQYTGTVYSVEGRQDTLGPLQVDQWRDPAQATQVQAFADDLLNSVKDTVVEGAITYYGLLTSLLTPGTSASVTGDSYTTGWEGLNLPIVECSLEWPANGPTSWRMSLHCSNRRGHLSEASYLRPERTFASPFGADQPFAGLDVGSDVRFTDPSGLAAGFGASGPLPTGMHDLGLPTSFGQLGLPTGPADLGIPMPPITMGSRGFGPPPEAEGDDSLHGGAPPAAGADAGDEEAD